MASQSRRPDYVYYFYGALLLLSSGTLEYFHRDNNYSRALYVGLLGLILGVWRLLIARYNLHRPHSPIRFWLSQMCVALAVFLTGLGNFAFGGANYELIFALSAVAAVSGGYYYVKDRSKT